MEDRLASDTGLVVCLFCHGDRDTLRLYSDNSAGVGLYFLSGSYPGTNSPEAIYSSLVFVRIDFFSTSNSCCFFFDILGL